MEASLIDIGVNLAHAQFREDRDDVMARAVAAGVAQMIVTGTNERASVAASDLARERRGVLYATAGVHPHNAKECGPRTIDALRELCRTSEVVCVGECGLDYNRDFSPRPVQDRWFAEQLGLAAEMRLPVFLHERDAHPRFIAIVREQRAALVGGVVHCFTGTAAEAGAYLDLGLDIGITGWICDERRGLPLRDVVRKVPLDRLMIETDAPFLAPRSMRPRPSRNEPAFLPHVLKALADALGRPADEVATATTANARRLFSKMKPAPAA
jgi:TatD DNase family protein